MPQTKKYTERIDIPFPAGTKARARKLAESEGFDTTVPYLRRIILDALAERTKHQRRFRDRT